MTSPCPWCATPFTPRARGAEQRFCSAACRQSFHAAARAWGQAMVDAGLMPAMALKAWAEGRERTGEAVHGSGSEIGRAHRAEAWPPGGGRVPGAVRGFGGNGCGGVAA